MSSNPIYTLKCSECEYTAQVVGVRYFESSCRQDIATRKCNRCNRLFIAAVTEKATRVELPNNEEATRLFEEDKDKYFSLVRSYMNWESPIYGAELKTIKCLWCGSKHNEEWDKRRDNCPKCGGKLKRSKAKQPEITTVKEFASFKDMTNSSLQVIACFMDDWCVPCSILLPVIDEINMEYQNKFKFVTFDMDYAERYDLVHKYKLKHFPTFLLFKDGKFKGKFSNVSTKLEFLKKMSTKFEDKGY